MVPHRQNPFHPRDPQFAQRVRTSFEGQPAMGLIGAQLASVEPGLCEVVLPFRPDLTQHHGYIHGGVVGMIADNAAGFAAASLTSADASVLTAEYKINLMAPAEGERLVARGRVVRAGRNLIITTAEVFAVRQDTWTLCALLQQTIMVMHGKGEHTGSGAAG